MSDTISLNMANKMLPLVKPIVSDIVSAWQEVVDNIAELQEIYLLEVEAPTHLSQAVRNTKSFTKIIVKRIDELEQLGCFIESFKEGIVDFPSTIDKADVMLCWKLGEEEVLHYHRRGENIEHRLLIVRELE